jgi:hypothetical protein
MGEWSDYFEDFPEENSANQINGSFNPEDAVRMEQVREESRALQSKLDKMAAAARARGESDRAQESAESDRKELSIPSFQTILPGRWID